jgi:hypothetical protein
MDNLDLVEGFLKDQEVGRGSQAPLHVLPAIVRICGANHGLQIGIDVAKTDDGFHAIPSRPANVDEGQRVGSPLGKSHLDLFQAFLAIIGGVDPEIRHRSRKGAEQKPFLLRRLTTEDLAEIVVDLAIVVDY